MPVIRLAFFLANLIWLSTRSKFCCCIRRTEVEMKHKATFELELNERVLLVSAFGVWTLNDAKDYVRRFRTMVQPIVMQPWCIIMDATAWKMSPSEVFALLQHHTSWSFANNLRMAVTILPDDQLLQWQFSKATAIEKPENFISKTAQDMTTARQMARAEGFIKSD